MKIRQCRRKWRANKGNVRSVSMRARVYYKSSDLKQGVIEWVERERERYVGDGLLLCVCYVNRSLVTDPLHRIGQLCYTNSMPRMHVAWLWTYTRNRNARRNININPMSNNIWLTFSYIYLVVCIFITHFQLLRFLKFSLFDIPRYLFYFEVCISSFVIIPMS